MWVIVMGILSGWLVVAVAVSFGIARAITLRDRQPVPAQSQLPDHDRALAA